VDHPATQEWKRARLREANIAIPDEMARAGEPFQLFFDPAVLVSDLARLQFGQIEDLAPDQINARYFAGRADGLAVSGGGHFLSCQVL
jgi:O-methyltransferase involved in polyketide biosynthesis